MKVPYLKEKRRKEMTDLASEFGTTISTYLVPETLNQRLHTGWLNNLHSIFALLQVLLNSKHNLNPSKEYALHGAKKLGNSELFLESMNAFQAPSNITHAMRDAYAATIFSGFIAELRSDLMMVFVHGLMYSYRNAAISLRCSLEDLYRHLYYMDHPQEYQALRDGRESEHSMNLNPQRLREYLSRTNYLKCFSDVSSTFLKKSALPNIDMDLFGVNDELYGSLSSAVHGASEDWFAALQNPSSLKPNLDKEKKMEALCTKFSKMCVAFLIAAHRDVFASTGDYDKSIVFDLYTNEERKNLRVLLNL